MFGFVFGLTRLVPERRKKINVHTRPAQATVIVDRMINYGRQLAEMEFVR